MVAGFQEKPVLGSESGNESGNGCRIPVLHGVPAAGEAAINRAIVA
jgi:hypothetical protein